eukprot:1190366-Prorocentrum_minimum.AAC.10
MQGARGASLLGNLALAVVVNRRAGRSVFHPLATVPRTELGVYASRQTTPQACELAPPPCVDVGSFARLQVARVRAVSPLPRLVPAPGTSSRPSSDWFPPFPLQVAPVDMKAGRRAPDAPPLAAAAARGAAANSGPRGGAAAVQPAGSSPGGFGGMGLGMGGLGGFNNSMEGQMGQVRAPNPPAPLRRSVSGDSVGDRRKDDDARFPSPSPGAGGPTWTRLEPSGPVFIPLLPPAQAGRHGP